MAIGIGNVAVTDEACTNPYTYSGPERIGDARVAALRKFRDGADTTGLALWLAPAIGGAMRISRDDVDWSGMRS